MYNKICTLIIYLYHINNNTYKIIIIIPIIPVTVIPIIPIIRPIFLLTLDFRGFDSSRLLILRDGNSHVR